MVMGAKGASAELQMVGPEAARAWIDAHAYNGQRPLARQHVEFLAEAMRRGEWEPSDVEFRTLPDGRKFLVNGQHGLHAIIRCGNPQWMFVKDLSADDLGRVSLSYGRRDRGRGRNLRDVFSAFGLADELRVTARDMLLLAAATQVIGNDFGIHSGSSYTSKSAELRAETMRGWADEMRRYSAVIQGTSSALGRRLRMGAVAAVGLVTLRHLPELAQGFWRAVALNDGLRRGEPAHTLVEYLVDVGRYGRPHEGTLERACARAWNAHHEGRTLTLIKMTDPSSPILIAGTPWNGGSAAE